VVLLLLERGARTHPRDADGNTAEALALAAGHQALAKRIASASRGPGLRDLF
jgi:ankyrin repeat protein